MISVIKGINLSKNIAFSSLLLLAACGGGGGGSDPAPSPGPSGLQLAAGETKLVENTTVGKPTWTNGSGTGAPIDGVICAPSETYHAHAVVSIYQNGARLALPAQIGLVGCAYELHTHDGTGIVHLEAASQKTFTLGQFFSVWGQPLTTASVAGLSGTPSFYIVANGKVTPFNGDPKTLVLAPHTEIAIVVGTAPAQLDRNVLPTGF